MDVCPSACSNLQPTTFDTCTSSIAPTTEQILSARQLFSGTSYNSSWYYYERNPKHVWTCIMKPLGALGVLLCVVVISRSVLASCTRISDIVDWQGTTVYAFLQFDRHIWVEYGPERGYNYGPIIRPIINTDTSWWGPCPTDMTCRPPPTWSSSATKSVII